MLDSRNPRLSGSPIASSRLRATPTRLEEALLWYHFVPDSGTDGRDWYIEYQRSGCQALGYKIDIAVDRMRRRNVASGKAMLDECRAVLETHEFRRLPRCVAGVAEEGYFGATAYFHYHTGEPDAAHAALECAAAWIADVVASAPYLAAFATKCHDFCLHRARIARNQARWADMWSRIREGREMLAGERPLCGSGDAAVYIDRAEALYRTATAADDIERRALDMLCDRAAMLAGYDRRALGATIPPGIVVDH